MSRELPETIGGWHTPTLGIDCPHCGEWFDAFEQIYAEDEWWTIVTPLTGQTDLKVELTCPDCKGDFIMTETEW